MQDRANGKLILVTAINPTPAGEGKTTTTVGLGDGLNRIGKKAAICIREASLGPCFGMKGGAAGGGCREEQLRQAWRVASKQSAQLLLCSTEASASGGFFL